MTFRFAVLASGSTGNASFIDADGFGVLLDVGIGPRLIASRLAALGLSWKNVHAALLTHTHSDHWNHRTLMQLAARRIPFYCHAEHRHTLRATDAYSALANLNLVRNYQDNGGFFLSPALQCRPIAISHDGGETFGFRLEGAPDFFGQPHALAYAADLGVWRPELARSLADVDLLALEFNHDVGLEKNSGRAPQLIERVLGDRGHLSNAQAAALVQEILRASTKGRLRHLVQLHLSRECNRRYLAHEAARSIVSGQVPPIEIHTAYPDRTTRLFTLGSPSKRQKTHEMPTAVRRSRTPAHCAGPTLFD